MKTLQDIITLLKNEPGKIFVMDETGEVQLVVMGVGEYKKMQSAEGSMQNRSIPDPEFINREIVNAQVASRDAADGHPRRQEPALPVAAKGSIGGQVNPYPATPPPTVSTDFAKRDMREEVIDPSFDFDAPEDL